MACEPEEAITACAVICERMGIEACMVLPMARYLVLLERWNQKHNLTAVVGTEARVTRHLLDSLTVRPWLSGEHILDVGSGAGLPGLILAIADQVTGRMDRHYTLLDSALKRVRFLRAATAELEISNVTVAHSRIEDYHPSLLFSTVVSRAFAEPASLVERSAHCVAGGGRWIAMTGPLSSVARPLSDAWTVTHCEASSDSLRLLPGSRYIQIIERSCA